MRLRVLVDNHTYIDQYYLGEPAVSYYLEIDGLRILFDTGYSDIVLRNAAAMGIDLGGLTHIVLSHGHNSFGLPHGSGPVHRHRMLSQRHLQSYRLRPADLRRGPRGRHHRRLPPV